MRFSLHSREGFLFFAQAFEVPHSPCRTCCPFRCSRARGDPFPRKNIYLLRISIDLPRPPATTRMRGCYSPLSLKLSDNRIAPVPPRRPWPFRSAGKASPPHTIPKADTGSRKIPPNPKIPNEPVFHPQIIDGQALASRQTNPFIRRVFPYSLPMLRATISTLVQEVFI